MYWKLKCLNLCLWQVNTSLDKPEIREVISIYQKFEDWKAEHNIWYPFYFFRM